MKRVILIRMPVLVDTALLKPNPWNPNRVARPEMELLRLNILKNGFCFPLVVAADENGGYVIVDGFHRHLLALEFGMPKVPVVILDTTMDELMAATVAFNRAKGTHQVDRMARMVGELVVMGLTSTQVAKALGMDADEVLRLMQHSGMPGVFAGRQFSDSWEPGNGEEVRP